MDEYINRKLITDSLEEIYNDIPVWEDGNKGIKEGIWVAMSCINALPSAQPERIRGRWIDKDGGLATCSACGDRWGVWSVMNFCPNCGADMREKGENATD